MNSHTSLSRGAGVALWRQISEALEREIRDGVHPAGARLPTEAELSERFGVNRHTVRRAMAELEERGLIDVTQGRGTFVHLGAIAYLIGRRTRFHENMRRENRTARLELLESATEQASGPIARELEVPAGTPVIRLDTRSHADGLPLSLASHYFPAARFPGLVEIFRETGSVTASFARYGIADYTRRRTRVSARLPDAREQRLLEITRTRPVMATEAINVDAEGAVVEFGLSSFASDRIQLVFEG
ncbi:phosphonate metabolism transcriptional regulator PhnF [Mycobacterium sp. KBS0706]|uniref:phosphonate metabolism transcriptional regulator PhnF n=1 Tax=Mycobacterium sp. KBS0706 TaxID=2578109 RepID=UPI00110FDC3F|nr:phosphonate metabolism transcriptional regulator PhnF [Mycobacterium sp. KBS0706]TSD86299.1 phosphonate metabolism transcriptional regulator PhnF [Mycobacterium sp. KBS0706]